MRPIRVATITSWRPYSERYATTRIELHNDSTADHRCYRWYGVDDTGMYDTETSAATVAEAIDAAIAAWGSGWCLEASWLRS